MIFTKKYISERVIEYNFGSEISKDINDVVLKVYRFFLENIDKKSAGILDIVPSYTSLSIYFTSTCNLFEDIDTYDNDVKKAIDMKENIKVDTHEVYVDYSGEDIEFVCKTLSLTKEQLIELHVKSYSIAMIGFREHFPYLLGLDEKLNIPRRESPRTFVKKGSVAIAAGQSGIYPLDLPGGWHIIGHTDFDKYELLKPSDIIIFKDKNAD